VLDTRTPGARQQLALPAGVDRWQRAVARESRLWASLRPRRVGTPTRGAQRRSVQASFRSSPGWGLRPARTAQRLGIARSSVYRCLPPDYQVEPKPRRVPREPLNPATIQVLLRSGMGPTAIAANLARFEVEQLSPARRALALVGMRILCNFPHGGSSDARQMMPIMVPDLKMAPWALSLSRLL
jgi:hypothetical protein